MAEPDWNAFFAARADRMLDELEALVRVESPSRDAEGVAAVAARLGEGFAAAGARVDVRDGHPHGPSLVARYGSGARPVMVLGHTDTVWPRGSLERLGWRVEGGRAYGPGVFDMKAGCVVALEAVRGLAAHGVDVPVAVVLSCDEEIGSPSARPLVVETAAASRAVLVFEPSIPGGLAKTSRSGMAAYDVRVAGRAAHAGVDPEKGVSAVAVAAEIVGRLVALADLARGLSVNVGVIRGGTRRNVVAAEAELAVDVRFRTREQAERVDAAVRALAGTAGGATVVVEGGVDRPPLEPTEAGRALYERATEAARRSGFELGHGHVGGVSDGNFTAAAGVPTLDGLGPDGLGAHADHEQVVVADVPRRAAMLARLLVDLADGGGPGAPA
jgi:glutamate carboxypeptidase